MVIEFDKEKIAGFCVVYLDEDADDCVIFCDSFAQMLQVAEQKRSEGFPVKTFIEYELEMRRKPKSNS